MRVVKNGTKEAAGMVARFNSSGQIRVILTLLTKNLVLQRFGHTMTSGFGQKIQKVTITI